MLEGDEIAIQLLAQIWVTQEAAAFVVDEEYSAAPYHEVEIPEEAVERLGSLALVVLRYRGGMIVELGLVCCEDTACSRERGS